MGQQNKDPEKLLLSRMHILSSPCSPAVHCSVPFQTHAGDTGQAPASVAVSPLPFPPSLGQMSLSLRSACCVHSTQSHPSMVTRQPSCSVPLCREEEEEPNLIYSVLHFHAK